MLIRELKEELSEEQVEIICNSEDQAFHSVRLFRENTDPLPQDQDVLYVGTAEAFKNADIPETMNCLSVPDQTSLADILNKVLAIMDSYSRRFAGTEILMLSSMLRKEDFELGHVADVLHELLGNPFGICNPSGTLILFRDLQEVHLEDLISDWTADDVYRKNFISTTKQCEEVDHPVLFNNGGQRHVLGKIMSQEKSIAYLMVVEKHHAFREADIELIDIVCKWLGKGFGLNPLFLNPEYGKPSVFLMDLITEQAGDSADIQKRAARLNLGQKPWNFLMLLTKEEKENPQISAQIQQLIQNHMPGCHVTQYYENLIVYVNTDKEAEAETYYNEILKLTESYHVKIGVSAAYKELRQTALAFKQCKFALETGMRFYPEETLFLYNTYKIYNMIDVLQSCGDPMVFVDNRILALLNTDKEHGTEYLQTIYVLLSVNGKQVDAAKKLHIHRSTLLYRMEKIEEIVGRIDVNDTYTMVLLYISFSILVYKNELPPDQFLLHFTEQIE